MAFRLSDLFLDCLWRDRCDRADTSWHTDLWKASQQQRTNNHDYGNHVPDGDRKRDLFGKASETEKETASKKTSETEDETETKKESEISTETSSETEKTTESGGNAQTESTAQTNAGTNGTGADEQTETPVSETQAVQTQAPETQAPETQASYQPVYMTVVSECYLRSTPEYGDNILTSLYSGTVVEFWVMILAGPCTGQA